MDWAIKGRSSIGRDSLEDGGNQGLNPGRLRVRTYEDEKPGQREQFPAKDVRGETV